MSHGEVSRGDMSRGDMPRGDMSRGDMSHGDIDISYCCDMNNSFFLSRPIRILSRNRALNCLMVESFNRDGIYSI